MRPCAKSQALDFIEGFSNFDGSYIGVKIHLDEKKYSVQVYRLDPVSLALAVSRNHFALQFSILRRWNEI